MQTRSAVTVDAILDATMQVLLACGKERLTTALFASVATAALNGISRRVLESKSPERAMHILRDELIVLVHAYLRTCNTAPLS